MALPRGRSSFTDGPDQEAGSSLCGLKNGLAGGVFAAGFGSGCIVSTTVSSLILPLGDAIFAACFKVYSTFSGRRFMSDLLAAQEKGYIRKTPHFNTIFNSLEDPEVFEVLRSLVVETSLPLKAVETEFAIDSTGFSACRFVR